MPCVLILSSLVAASRVGGGLQALTLAARGCEPILAPTVLFGRHPGLGPPGGAAVDEAVFAGMLEGIEAAGVFPRLSAVITGYFAGPGQVARAARAVEAVGAVNPAASIIVDPIMGDEAAGLYVSEATAQAIAADLVPLAGLIAPNTFELARLSGRPSRRPAEVLAAARALGAPALVSSVDAGRRIGVAYVDRDEAWLAAHARIDAEPKGTGDLLAAVFVAERLAGAGAREALERAAQSLAASVTGEAEAPVSIEALA